MVDNDTQGAGAVNTDQNANAGGQQAGSQTGAQGQAGSIVFPNSQALEVRLDRERRQIQSQLRERGLLLTEEEANALKESRTAAEREQEETKKKTGKFEDLYKSAQEKLQAEINAKVQFEGQYKSRIDELQLDHALSSAIGAFRLREGVQTDEVAAIIKMGGTIKMIDGQPTIVDKDGTMCYSKVRPGEPMDIKEYAGDWLKTREYYLAPSNGTGAGMQMIRGAGAKFDPAIIRSDAAALAASPEQRAAAVASLREEKSGAFDWNTSKGEKSK